MVEECISGLLDEKKNFCGIFSIKGAIFSINGAS